MEPEKLKSDPLIKLVREKLEEEVGKRWLFLNSPKKASLSTVIRSLGTGGRTLSTFDTSNDGREGQVVGQRVLKSQLLMKEPNKVKVDTSRLW